MCDNMGNNIGNIGHLCTKHWCCHQLSRFVGQSIRIHITGTMSVHDTV
ncbi:hypothetical protein BLA29_003591 [Euroglyphus maynei]|uniref:Uncharacterized protein n=1 Tax=Euroglyphus maynei TaxID=6958 RepID=A0A1Y3BLK9_EURMA|nr:hypothetical protein BLA29_003591 [Euroglyphus maynei]